MYKKNPWSSLRGMYEISTKMYIAEVPHPNIERKFGCAQRELRPTMYPTVGCCLMDALTR
eukprot:1320261-Pyramimonas_sp.AAC.1